MAYRGLWDRITETPRETGSSAGLSRVLWRWFEYFLWESLTSKQMVPKFVWLYGKEYFSDIQTESPVKQLVLIASCPVTVNPEHTWHSWKQCPLLSLWLLWSVERLQLNSLSLLFPNFSQSRGQELDKSATKSGIITSLDLLDAEKHKRGMTLPSSVSQRKRILSQPPLRR